MFNTLQSIFISYWQEHPRSRPTDFLLLRLSFLFSVSHFDCVCLMFSFLQTIRLSFDKHQISPLFVRYKSVNNIFNGKTVRFSKHTIPWWSFTLPVISEQTKNGATTLATRLHPRNVGFSVRIKAQNNQNNLLYFILSICFRNENKNAHGFRCINDWERWYTDLLCVHLFQTPQLHLFALLKTWTRLKMELI